MLAVVASLLLAGAPTAEIPAAERRTLPVVIVAPGKSMAMTSRTDLIRRLDEVAKAQTQLVVAPLPDAPSCLEDASVSRFRCLTLLARADERKGAISELLVVSVVPSADHDRMFAVLIDTKIASELIDRSTNASTIDSQIRRHAIVARAEPLEINSPSDVGRFVEALFTGDFRAALERAGHLSSLGTIALEVPKANFEVRLDGRALPGVTRPPVTHITEVAAGGRHLRLLHPEYELVETTLEVRANEIASWRPQLVPRRAVDRVANHVVRWGGVGVAAVGLGIGAYTALSTPQADWYCFGEADEGGCAALNTTLRPVGGTGAPHDAMLPNEGLPWASVALGLTALGVTAAVLNFVLAEDERFPWLEILVGIGAGAVGFGAPLAVQAL